MCFEFLAENTRQVHMLITLWVFYCLFVSGWQIQALFSRFRKFGCDPNKKKKIYETKILRQLQLGLSVQIKLHPGALPRFTLRTLANSLVIRK